MSRPGTGLTRCILVVEGDADTRDMYRTSLEEAGFAVEEASDAAEALDRLKTLRPDAIVTEILLPGSLDGFALCRRIRKAPHTTRIPMLAVTGYSSPDRVERATHAGFDTLLLKPVLPDDLIEEIDACIRKRASEPESREDSSEG